MIGRRHHPARRISRVAEPAASLRLFRRRRPCHVISIHHDVAGDRSLPLRCAHFEDLAWRCEADAAHEEWPIPWLADNLKVPIDALHVLRVGWSKGYCAFAFPMRHVDGRICGIRLRRPDGRKLAVRGSREGMFRTEQLVGGGPLLVVEGASDTAVAVGLGFDVIGRPSANRDVLTRADRWAIQNVKARDIVVIGDRDTTGLASVRRFAAAAMTTAESVRCVVPPHPFNDLRDWVNSGLSRTQLRSLIGSAPRLGARVRGNRGR